MERFGQRWEFRSKDSDLDSSSSDSRTNIRATPKHKKQKIVPDYAAAEVTEGTSQHRGKEENRPLKQKGKQKRNKTAAFDYDSAAAMHSLQNHIGLLVQEITVAKQSMFKWMEDEIGKLVTDDAPSKPTRRRKSGRMEARQPQGERRSKPGGIIKDQSGRRGKKKGDNGNSDQGADQKQAGIGEVVGSLVCAVNTTTTALAEKERLTMPYGMCVSKQNLSIDPSDKASSSNYLTTPATLSRPQTGNTQSNPTPASNVKPLADHYPSIIKAMPAAMRSDETYFGGLPQSDNFLAKRRSENIGVIDSCKNAASSNGGGFQLQLYSGLAGGFGMLNSSHIGLDHHLAQCKGMVPNVGMNGKGIRFSGGGPDIAAQRKHQ